MYKVGITNSLQSRIKTYNTGNANNVEYEYIKKTKCTRYARRRLYRRPNEIEQCVKAILYKYRYRKNREFFTCSLNKIIKTIDSCIKIEKKCNNCADLYICNKKIDKYNKLLIEYNSLFNKN